MSSSHTLKYPPLNLSDTPILESLTAPIRIAASVSGAPDDHHIPNMGDDVCPQTPPRTYALIVIAHPQMVIKYTRFFQVPTL